MAERILRSSDGSVRHFDEAMLPPNTVALADKLDSAITYFGSRGQTSTFSFTALANNAARDAHIRRMNSAIESLARLVQGQLDSAGD